jgi:hypothetical protein
MLEKFSGKIETLILHLLRRFAPVKRAVVKAPIVYTASVVQALQKKPNRAGFILSLYYDGSGMPGTTVPTAYVWCVNKEEKADFLSGGNVTVGPTAILITGENGEADAAHFSVSNHEWTGDVYVYLLWNPTAAGGVKLNVTEFESEW